jgi:lipoprotein signal peptidase
VALPLSVSPSLKKKKKKIIGLACLSILIISGSPGNMLDILWAKDFADSYDTHG